MRKLNKKFENLGSVLNALRSGHPRSICNEENLQTVAQAFVASPGSWGWWLAGSHIGVGFVEGVVSVAQSQVNWSTVV
ncbi:hypothetical protein J6590_068020 [Homalodisca vitripennis]|nr:hypothetical protein J6590_068020 [Homalodisca vitripennis]